MTKREKVQCFMRWYEGSLGDTDSAEAAYQLTETVWIREHNARMYKNYGSFRAARVFWFKHSRNAATKNHCVKE